MVPFNILRNRREWQSLFYVPGHSLSFQVPVLLVVLLGLSLVLLGGWSRVELPEFRHEQPTSLQFHQALKNGISTDSPNKDPGSKATLLGNRSSTIHEDQGLGATLLRNKSSTVHKDRGLEAASQRPGKEKMEDGPYYNWELFDSDYQEMLQHLKIFVYPDAFMHNQNQSSPFADIFLPHPNPYNPKLGNYFSEHAFKISLLESPLITEHPEEANFFFSPFSINVMRYHPLLHSESTISDFVAQYTTNISLKFRYWNASGGADHFYISCHSVGRDAASKHLALHHNAIQGECRTLVSARHYLIYGTMIYPLTYPPRMERSHIRKYLDVADSVCISTLRVGKRFGDGNQDDLI